MSATAGRAGAAEAGAGPDDQREVVAFLSRPDAWGPEVASVERRETHASHLFLAGTKAWKLKRAVRYPYLDYSTAARRRHFCEAEVEVNRPAAGGLYRGVVPVVRTPAGGLAVGGEGTPVDWLVEMERFDEDALFDHLAGQGRLDRLAMESLADTVAEFHREAERRPDAGGAAGVEATLAGNRGCFAQADPKILDRVRTEELVARSAALFAAVAPLLDKRRDEGFVRRCHGDLHLRNIVALDGRAVLFDAIEFEPAFAEIDVLYDLAFLVMDLYFRDLGRLGSILLNRYLDNTGDAAGLATLPLFLAMRAAIRAHVDAAAAGALSLPDEAAVLAAAAGRYLDLALACTRPAEPRLIAIGGLSGAGKSRLARELAPCLGPAPGARVVRTDSTRKRLAGVSLETRLAPRDYSEAASRRTYAAAFDEARLALAAGLPVIADAVFAKPDERAEIEAVAAEFGVPFRGLWLETAPRVMEQRVTDRVRNVSDAGPEVVRLQLAYDVGTIGWTRMDSSGAGGATLQAAADALGLETIRA